MFDPKPGEFYQHDDKPGVSVQIIGENTDAWSKIAPAMRCATFINGEYKGETSIWLDILHNNYTLVAQ